MTETENLVLELLRRIRTSVDDMREDIRELKVRTSAIEMQTATLSGRMDRFDERLARIERRLELTEA